jgi:hypothetical protein
MGTPFRSGAPIFCTDRPGGFVGTTLPPRHAGPEQSSANSSSTLQVTMQGKSPDRNWLDLTGGEKEGILSWASARAGAR